MNLRAVAILSLTLGVAPAQVVRSIRAYSEFQRVDPFGEIVAVDRAQTPREILSPGVARNGHLSLHVAITADPKTMYFLAVQSNPRGIFQWKIYREEYVRSGGSWIPEGLEEIREPYFAVMPDPAASIAGQTTQSYLVDVWVPPETPVGTMRLEVLVKSEAWRLWPMEVRVLPVSIPAGAGDKSGTPMRPVDLPADAFTRSGAVTDPLTIRAVIRRNALEDEALAGQVTVNCRDAGDRSTQGAERYLRVRDCLYRAARPGATR